MILLLLLFAFLVTGEPQVEVAIHGSYPTRSSTLRQLFISMSPSINYQPEESSLGCVPLYNTLMAVDMGRLLPKHPKTSVASVPGSMDLVPTENHSPTRELALLALFPDS